MEDASGVVVEKGARITRSKVEARVMAVMEVEVAWPPELGRKGADTGECGGEDEGNKRVSKLSMCTHSLDLHRIARCHPDKHYMI